MKYPIPEIPDDSEKKSGTDWVLPKNFGSGIGYPSDPGYQRVISGLSEGYQWVIGGL